MSGRHILISLMVVMIWGLNFIAIKLGLKDFPPFLLGALRFLAAAIPAIFFLPRPPVKWPWLIALGLTINTGQFGFLFLGMKLGVSAGLAALIIQSQAFFTLILAVTFLKEALLWNHLCGLAIAAAGLAIIGFHHGAEMSVAGFWFVLSAALSWGVGNIIIRKATRNSAPYSMLSLVVWAGAVAIIPLGLLSLFFEGVQAWVAAFHSINATSVAALVYIAYLATLVAYSLWGKLISRYPATVVSPFALLVPIISLSSAALFLGEILTLWQFLGVILVMTGLVVNVFGNKLIKNQS